MSWIDDIIAGFWDFVFSSELDALQSIYDFIKNLPNMVGEMLTAIMFLVTYPFIVMITIIRDVFNHTWSIFANFFNIPINFINVGYSLQEMVLPGFPPIWMWLLFLMISIRVTIVIVRWIWAIIP